MKNILIKKFAAAALITSVIMGTGCAKLGEFGDTNLNPNGISVPPTAALLTQVTSQMGGFASNLRRGLYAQYVSENQYTENSLYQLPLLEMSGTYSGPLQDLQTIIDLNSGATAGAAAASGSNANQIAIARILKAYIYWTVTDAWGNIPYTEALKGAANLTPKFDSQEPIYWGMINELKQAAASFDPVGAPIKGDLMYGGNTASWQRLANSMRMLMAIRLSQRYPAPGGLAALAFADAAGAAGGYMTSNAHNFTLQFPGGSFSNPWYGVYLTRDDYASSKTMGDVLSGLGDSRSSVFGTNNVMFPYGLTRDLAIQYGNSVGNGQSRVLAVSKRQAGSPVVVIPSSLVLLARAEALERAWIGPGGPAGSLLAEADYNAAIANSFNEWGLAVPGGYLAAGANYTAGAGVPASIGAGTAPYDNFNGTTGLQDAATPTKLSRIALQYWLCAFPNGNEGWASQRRTGVPNLKTTRFKTGPFVTRYVYGNSDYGLNNANTVAAAAAMGGDLQDKPVWWDF